MGLFNRTKKFAVVIALIGALSSSCKKALPKEEARNISRRADEITKMLKKGDIDNDKIKQFIRLVTIAHQKYKTDIEVPKDLELSINKLSFFYSCLFREEEKLRRGEEILIQNQNIIFSSLEFVEGAINISFNKEREELRKHLNQIMVMLDKKIEQESINSRELKKLLEKRNMLQRLIIRLSASNVFGRF